MAINENNIAKWNESELRLAILQVLYTAWRSNPARGASGIIIVNSLGLKEFKDFDVAMRWLRDKNFAELGDRAFLITDEGREFLEAQLPGIGRTSRGDSPQGGGGPNDPSRVPKRPFPITGAGQIALPLPSKDDWIE